MNEILSKKLLSQSRHSVSCVPVLSVIIVVSDTSILVYAPLHTDFFLIVSFPQLIVVSLKIRNVSCFYLRIVCIT